MNQKVISLIKESEPDYSKIPGGIRLPNDFRLVGYTAPKVENIMDDVMLIHNAISPIDCLGLINFFERNGKYAPVTIQGMQDVTDDTIGSNRITGFSPLLANDIYYYIKNCVERTKIVNQYTSTDFWQQFGKMQYDWQFAGVSPMLRFMKYQKNGQHFPHYDAGFIYPEKEYRTLKSFVLYLTTNQSGATRFVDDKQQNLTVFSRKHSDWDREPNKDEILHRVLPVQGDMLIFDHRLCHDVEPFIDETGDRIIIRGDLIYHAYNINK